MENKRAVVLLSGGLDSATTLAIARNQAFNCYALTCFYGQRHQVEIEAAKKVARSLCVEQHHCCEFDLGFVGGSALTDHALDVPKERLEEEIGSGIPVTYVPARNTILLSLALAWAEVLGAFDIFIGVNALDYSGYPDCRPEYIEAFEKMANLATAATAEGGGEIKIHTPIIGMTKAEVIKQGLALGVDYGLTHSCYDPSEEGISCRCCDACLLRLKGFSEAGAVDPIDYQKQN